MPEVYSGDRPLSFSGRISGMWCIGVYSDDGLHYIIVMAVFYRIAEQRCC